MLAVQSPCSALPLDSWFPLTSSLDSKKISLPLYGESVQAGFPSPADDWLEDAVDLNQKFVRNPAATILLRVAGDSMQDAGIFQGDFVVVDRSVEAKPGRIVVAAVNGEFTLKRLSRVGGKFWLMPENPDYSPIEITDEMEVRTFGVVVSVIRQL